MSGYTTLNQQINNFLVFFCQNVVFFKQCHIDYSFFKSYFCNGTKYEVDIKIKNALISSVDVLEVKAMVTIYSNFAEKQVKIL